jgi:DNA-directed RNA polymerase subunit M/transcription elongation factor TFIIS
MEVYAVNKLECIFHEYVPEPSETPGLYRKRAQNIVNALKKRYPFQDEFKLAFWKVLYNLVLNKPACYDNLHGLFNGKWNSAEMFINATHDELDPVKAEYRKRIRDAPFEKMNRMNDVLFYKELDEEEINNKQTTSGLQCPRCHSGNTEYLLLQTSRGDEGSTARSLCNDCGFRWKFR